MRHGDVGILFDVLTFYHFPAAAHKDAKSGQSDPPIPVQTDPLNPVQSDPLIPEY